MAPKHPSAHTRKKKQKAADKPPETADEYLSLGVSHEEAGEKWRGGDPVKALRFFTRAMDAYSEGIEAFPGNFDLAYNKARVSYDLLQRYVMRRQLSPPLIDLLNNALALHRRALSIEPQNADALFNTAQVLTSIADAEDEEEFSVNHLEEALRLLQECVMIQEQQFLEGQRLAAAQPSDPIEDEEMDNGGGVPLEVDAIDTSSVDDADESQQQWASVVEPVTAAAVVETCVTALDALAVLCSLVPTSNPNALGHLESISEEWMRKTNIAVAAVTSSEEEDSKIQARCAIFKLKAAMIEVRFRFDVIPLKNYSASLNELTDLEAATTSPVSLSMFCSPCLYTDPTIQPWELLASFADVNIAFATATSGSITAANTRWAKLAKALDFLGEAVRLAPSNEIASIHMGRGDVELLRSTVCREGGLPQNIANPAVLVRLLKNAETYYRNASTIAQVTTGQQEVFVSATIKSAFAKCLMAMSPDAISGLNHPEINQAEIRTVLKELVAESIVPISSLQMCGLAHFLDEQNSRSPV